MPFRCTARSSGRGAVCGQTCCRDQPAVRRLCRTLLFCPEAVLFCQQQRLSTERRPSAPTPAAGSGARRVQPAGILQTTAGGARLAEPGLPRFAQHPLYVPRQHGARPFSSRAASTISTLPLQWRRSAALRSFPVILRPDELSEGADGRRQ